MHNMHYTTCTLTAFHRDCSSTSLISSTEKGQTIQWLMP